MVVSPSTLEWKKVKSEEERWRIMKGVSLQGGKPKQQGWLSEDEVALLMEVTLKCGRFAVWLNEMATVTFLQGKKEPRDRNIRQELVSSSDAPLRYIYIYSFN